MGNETKVAVKRKAKDRMGRACVEGDEENGRTLQGGLDWRRAGNRSGSG